MHYGKTADRIQIPFGIIGRTGLVHGKGYFWGEFGARHCNQWGLYDLSVRQRRDAALFQNYFGQTCCELLCVSVQLAQLIVNAGGMAAMVDYVGDTCGNIRLPGIMMLGYVAAHSENLAMAVIVSKVGFTAC